MSSIKIIGVLGAGQMGSGIAQVAAGAGYSVRLADQSVDHVKKAVSKIEAVLGKRGRRAR
ncbi:MAG: 3-hydroxyacyl-CoA dehydrogenase NAD-binding domain-containing protein [Polyangiaceae bacterium]